MKFVVYRVINYKWIKKNSLRLTVVKITLNDKARRRDLSG